MEKEQGAPLGLPVWAGTRKAALKEQRQGQSDTSTKSRRKRRGKDKLTLCKYV